MTTHLDTGRLIKITEAFTFVNMVCQTRNKGQVMPRPKDSRGGIVDAMEDSLEDAKIVFKESHPLNWISTEVQNWIENFHANYRQNLASLEILSKKWSLDYEDSKKLEKDTNKWLKALLEHYKKIPNAFLNEEALTTIKDEMNNKLSAEAKNDLDDAINAIQSELATPAVMTLNRVAESMVKKLYEKEVGAPPGPRANWGDMVIEIERTIPQNDPILHLLHYRRGNRNTAQHPGKRYTTRDAEKTLYAVQELVDEIHLKL